MNQTKYSPKDYLDLDVLVRKELSYSRCALCDYYYDKQLVINIKNFIVCNECVSKYGKNDKFDHITQSAKG
jgi:uncharacterized protein with PIN domain